MFAIYKREVTSYFTTPIGYVFMAVFLAVSGFLFSLTTLQSQTSDVSSYFQFLMFAYVVVIPLLTMKSFSEERRTRTEQLLLTAPVSLTGIVLAKFSKQSSLVIATGGGAVILAENRRLLRENSVVLHLTRPLGELAKDGRPLSQANSAEALWNARRDFYRSVADAEIPVDADPSVTLSRVAEWWENLSLV